MIGYVEESPDVKLRRALRQCATNYAARVLAGLRHELASAEVELGAAAVRYADAVRPACVTRSSPTCMYLADGTKVVLRRKAYRGSERVWMENVPQAVLSAAAGEPNSGDKP